MSYVPMAQDALCFKSYHSSPPVTRLRDPKFMIDENDTLKSGEAEIKPQANDIFARFMAIAAAAKGVRAVKYVLQKLFAFSGELFTVICALGLAWLYAVSWLLTQQSVDLSRLKPDAARWFSQAFEGNSADVQSLSLRWLPARDNVVFEIHGITVRGDDGQVVQDFSEIKTGFTLRNVIAARPIPSDIDIRGGTLSWIEAEDGSLIAGLGTPETVGRLGPVYRGQLPSLAVEDTDKPQAANIDFKQALADFQSLSITDSTLYFRSKNNDKHIIVDLDNVNIVKEETQLDMALNGSLGQNLTAAPIKLNLSVDTDFTQFEGRAIATGLRPDLLAPRRGRYKALSGLSAAVDLYVDSLFILDGGLQASNISLNIGRGEYRGLAQKLPFKAAQFKAKLEPGKQQMKISTIALDSPKLSFTGRGDLTQLGALSDGDINSSPVFNVQLNDVAIDAVPTFTAPLQFQAVEASGQIDFDDRRLSLPRLSLELAKDVNQADAEQIAAEQISAEQIAAGQAKTRFDLSVEATQNAQTGKIETLQASGDMTGRMGPQDLLALWPAKAADGARRWVVSAVKSANINRFNFKADLDAAYFENPVFTEDYITAELGLSGGVVKYMRYMPEITDAIVNGRLIGNRIEADILSGRVGGLSLERGTVEMPRLIPIGGDIIINITGTGSAANMLSLVDNRPFEYATKYGVDPNKVGGQGRIDMRITRPMLVNFDQNRIEYAVKGDFFDATAPFEIMGQAVTEGQIRLEADKTGLLMSGPVKIGPWHANMEWREVFGLNPPPTRYTMTGLVGRDILDQFGIGLREYFDGTVPIEIQALGRGLDIQSGTLMADLTQAELSVSNVWSKAAGQASTLRAKLQRGKGGTISLPQVDLTAPGLELSGTLEIAQNLQLKILDFSKMRVDGLIDAAVQLKPDLNNQRFSLFVEGDYLDVSPWVSASLAARNSSAIDVPVLMTASIDRFILKEGYELSDTKLLFTHSGKSLSNLRLGGMSEDGPVSAELVSDPEDGSRAASLQIPNASKAISAFLGLTSTRGGKLDIKANLPPVDMSGPTLGSAVITDFKLERAPFLAQILSLASLTGLVDTLGGSGLLFERFDVPFTLDDSLLQVRNARLYGPALGMTGDGDIQIDARVLDIDGTVVPAYNANTILGDIPVLGSLLGKKGEGVFALNYAVTGSFEKAQISVNPLSALTPGFLRGIFRPQREKLSDEILEQIEAVRPNEDEN